MKVKTAAPRAKIAVSMPKKDMPGRKKPKPKQRKNSIVHQPAMELGIFI